MKRIRIGGILRRNLTAISEALPIKPPITICKKDIRVPRPSPKRKLPIVRTSVRVNPLTTINVII
ncbi:MAG: hypothetical protein QW775_08430, partial [Ignisphaera sp.]